MAGIPALELHSHLGTHPFPFTSYPPPPKTSLFPITHLYVVRSPPFAYQAVSNHSGNPEKLSSDNIEDDIDPHLTSATISFSSTLKRKFWQDLARWFRRSLDTGSGNDWMDLEGLGGGLGEVG